MRDKKKSILVSVIITTKNEENVIEDILGSIKKQSFKNFEIIVVDNNSTDKTVKISKGYTKIVFNKGPERSAQRNFGVRKAKGEYVLILDADMQLSKKVLEECVRVAQKSGFGAIVIPEKSFGRGFWAQFKIFEREFYEGEEDIEAARFFKKTLFKKFGGYDLSMTGPEDWDLPLRMRKAGVKIGRIKSYILHNERSFSPLRSARKKFYYASQAKVYLKRHPEMIVSQGNLLLRPVFFKKWKKLLANPFLSLGMFVVRSVEMTGAALGVLYSFGKATLQSNNPALKK